MRKQLAYSPAALRFRRWSRQGYAAFISIQRAVTIGQLSASVSERLQEKHDSIHTAVPAFAKADEEDADGKENKRRADHPTALLPLLFLPAPLPARPVATYAYTLTNIHIPESAEGPSYKLKAFRDFCLYKYKIT